MALPDHVRQLAARVSNTGRWGPDDQRGAQPRRRRRGAPGVAAAREGESSLAIPFDEDGPQTGAIPGDNPGTMLAVNAPYRDPADFCANDDAVAMGVQAAPTGTPWRT